MKVSTFALMTLVAAAACRTGGGEPRPQIVQPGAPGESSRVIPAAQAADLRGVQHTAADVAFMRGMIAHHAQALEMTALLASRTNREGMRLLGRRIELSQADEIEMMRRWLTARGQDTSGSHVHHAGGPQLMPGMLSAEEMARLASASGATFDVLFLESMIRHHEGALAMVQELVATPGAAQEPEVFAFVSDVEADQRMEIERMAEMLREYRR